jgi:surface protein
MRRVMLILLGSAVAAVGCDNQVPTGPAPDDPAAALATMSALTPATDITRDMCMKGGWQDLGFKNQGQCVSYVQTGKARMGFETTWDTRLGEGTTVTLGLTGLVDATIYWGDGTFSRVSTPGPHTHGYGKDGLYTVSVTGSVTAYDGWRLQDREKLVSIDSWGELGFTSLFYAFPQATNLVSVPGTTTGLEAVTNMGGMFWGATRFDADIRRWDVANVTIMMSMFGSASAFNQDIGGWDVSNVTNMNGMFNGATSFNQDIGGWDVSNARFMMSMFANTEAFNQDLSRWDVSNVMNMNYMFRNATGFNGDIGAWDVSGVTMMAGMFDGATSFDRGIGGWDVSNVAVMIGMFEGATSFNQDIGGWNVSGVAADLGGGWTGMHSMFLNAESFNQDLSGWCVAGFTGQPAGFDEGAISWMLPDSRPIWGTCPSAG